MSTEADGSGAVAAGPGGSSAEQEALAILGLGEVAGIKGALARGKVVVATSTGKGKARKGRRRKGKGKGGKRPARRAKVGEEEEETKEEGETGTGNPPGKEGRDSVLVRKEKETGEKETEGKDTAGEGKKGRRKRKGRMNKGKKKRKIKKKNQKSSFLQQQPTLEDEKIPKEESEKSAKPILLTPPEAPVKRKRKRNSDFAPIQNGDLRDFHKLNLKRRCFILRRFGIMWLAPFCHLDPLGRNIGSIKGII